MLGTICQPASPVSHPHLQLDRNKMDESLLSLKWNNHHSTFLQVLGSVIRKEMYSDATIACDGNFYPVHKLVLSTCSEYFGAMFSRTQGKHPIIVLKDIGPKELEALLNYMYVGEVRVAKEELDGLVKAAECLRIKGLAAPDEDMEECQSSTPRKLSSRGQASDENPSPHKKKKIKNKPMQSQGIASLLPTKEESGEAIPEDKNFWHREESHSESDHFYAQAEVTDCMQEQGEQHMSSNDRSLDYIGSHEDLSHVIGSQNSFVIPKTEPQEYLPQDSQFASSSSSSHGQTKSFSADNLYQEFLSVYQKAFPQKSPETVGEEVNVRWQRLKVSCRTESFEDFVKKEIKDLQIVANKNLTKSSWLASRSARDMVGDHFSANSSHTDSTASGEDRQSFTGRIYTCPAQERLQEKIWTLETQVSAIYERIEKGIATDQDMQDLEEKEKCLQLDKKMLKRKIEAAARSMKSRLKQKLAKQDLLSSNPSLAKNLYLQDKSGRPVEFS